MDKMLTGLFGLKKEEVAGYGSYRHDEELDNLHFSTFRDDAVQGDENK